MRTTIDLPDDLHDVVRQLSHDRRESMSRVVTDLVRRGITAPREPLEVAVRRGVPIISVGHPVTMDDVRSLEDE